MKIGNIKLLTGTVMATFMLSGCMDETTVANTASSEPKAAKIAAKAPETKPTTMRRGVFQLDPIGDFVGIQSKDSKYGGYQLIAQARNVEGMTAICGTMFTSFNSIRRVENLILQDKNFLIGNKKMVSRMDFVNKVTTSAIARRPMNCRLTSVPWEKSFEDKTNWNIRHTGSGRYKL